MVASRRRRRSIAVERREPGREHWAHELPDGGAHGAVAARECVAELSCHPFGAQRLGAGDTGGIEHERGREPGSELGDSAYRVWVGERALELGVDDCVDMGGFMAAGVADGPLALGVGPARSVGDQLPVVADEQPADDVPDGAKLRFAGLDQSRADVVPEPEIAARGFGLARPRLGASLLVFGGGVAELAVVDPRAGEVGLLSSGRGPVVLDLLVDEVDHERWVDDPDAGGEVASALVHERVPAVAGAVAHLTQRRSGARLSLPTA